MDKHDVNGIDVASLMHFFTYVTLLHVIFFKPKHFFDKNALESTLITSDTHDSLSISHPSISSRFFDGLGFGIFCVSGIVFDALLRMLKGKTRIFLGKEHNYLVGKCGKMGESGILIWVMKKGAIACWGIPTLFFFSFFFLPISHQKKKGKIGKLD